MRIAAPSAAARDPGLGLGWTKVAHAIADHVPRAEIDGIWLFPPVRRDEREWGVAVVARRAEQERRRIYTASYMLVVRGRERGQGKVAVEEVGESPSAVVHEVIRGVQRRAGEAEPPIEIAPELWFDPLDEPPGSTEGAPDAASPSPDDTANDAEERPRSV